MQIVFIGDKSHKMSNPVFVEKIRKKKIKMSSAENFTQNAKRKDGCCIADKSLSSRKHAYINLTPLNPTFI